ncbi:MAG: hypothetical protein A3F83_03845 [Candidatus Glassbacteria bacterium RIFCSPLOWO2_12_FULL_58_11]|uniref:3-keto-alpha-glucoside-1,2-lyase/3-keto-2-hydroxy-glucal hydratase domain-containing protein n=1 Tax=Candidatus Glassbacteria bacterium RIFCSPLOWO2_12_FULL_58_11 TaxID=1817867 RepID=A0A1F5YKM1_9BACT|nr:MAG: hypothetical protein A3F83_03845 [Candidatus Glassbacteria bacterium RIFCSPLOWO2_12_FULL_58_11]
MSKSLVCFSLALTLLFASNGKAAEKGFVSLFNGKDLSSWQFRGQPAGLRVEEGCIYSGGADGGDLLWTEKEYGNYILRLEWMLSGVGNSGVLIRCTPDSAWDSGFEVQLLAPWTPWRDDLHCTGSIYGYVAVTNRPDETTGRWHQLEVVCDRKQIIIAVNGETCTWADMDRVESLRGKHLRGRIGLQGNHSDPQQWLKFRNLRLRDLDLDPDYVIRGFRDTDPRIQRDTHGAAVKLGDTIVPRLCSLIAEEDSLPSAGARKALFEIAALASAPDAPKALRDKVVQALKDQAGSSGSETLRTYLGWLLGLLGA